MFRGSAYSLQTDKDFQQNINNIYLQQTIKIGVVGGPRVGKSSIIRSISNQSFQSTITPTRGIQFIFKKLRINRYIVNLYLWDSSGQLMNKYIKQGHLKQMDGIMMVFDLMQIHSLNQIQQLYQQIRLTTNLPIVLAGNKADIFKLKNNNIQEIQKIHQKMKENNSLAEKFAQKNNLLYLKVSAKQNSFVTDSFVQLIKQSLTQKKRLRTSRSIGDEQIFQIHNNDPNKQVSMIKMCRSCSDCIIF